MTAWAQREYTGIAELRGPLMVVRGVDGVGWDEFAAIRTQTGETRHGLVLEADRDLAVVQVLREPAACGRPGPGSHSAAVPCGFRRGGLARRACNGCGDPIDGGPPVTGDVTMPVAGFLINPVRASRSPSRC